MLEIFKVKLFFLSLIGKFGDIFNYALYSRLPIVGFCFDYNFDDHKCRVNDATEDGKDDEVDEPAQKAAR